MRLSLRFVVPLLLALGAFAYIAVLVADSLMLRWFVRDLDIRSNLIASTGSGAAVGLIATGSAPRIAGYFNRMLLDERLYAVGLCLDASAEPIATGQFPPEISAPRSTRYVDAAASDCMRTSRGVLHIAGSPDRHRRHARRAARARPRHELRRAPQRGNAALPLLLLRRARARAIALITVVIAQLSWRGWVQGLRALLRGEGILRPRAGRPPRPSSVRSRATCAT